MLTALDMQRVRRRYGSVWALRDVSLASPPGEVVLIMGANGAGKSTLLRVAAGLARPHGGQIVVMGRALNCGHHTRAPIGYLSHHTQLYDDLTARENLRFAAALHSLADADVLVMDALNTAGLAQRADLLVGTMSHGTRQRLAIARALLHRPAVVLLDEPFSGLDLDAAELLQREIARAVERGAAVWCVTHQPAEIWDQVQRVVVMRGGQLVEDVPRPDSIADWMARYKQELRHPIGEPAEARSPSSTLPAGAVPLRNDLRRSAGSLAFKLPGAIARKDLRIEWRHRTAFAGAVMFALLVLLTFVFARDSGSVSLAAMAPEVIWATLALASIVVINRGFVLEREHHAFDAMLIAPISASAVFWGKWLANLALVLCVELVAIPAWMLFFDLTITPRLLWMFLVGAVAAVAFTAPGTLFSAMAVRTRFAELLLPVLLLPFTLPAIFFAANAGTSILSGAPIGVMWEWLRLLALYDVAFLSLATLLFPQVMDQ